MYGKCEQYGKNSLIQKIGLLLKRKKGFITIPVIDDLSQYDQHEEEM